VLLAAAPWDRIPCCCVTEACFGRHRDSADTEGHLCHILCSFLPSLCLILLYVICCWSMQVFSLTHDFQAAIDIYSEALQHSPENTEILTTLGILYLRANETEVAFSNLGNSLCHDPKNARTILAVGSMIQVRQKQRKAGKATTTTKSHRFPRLGLNPLLKQAWSHYWVKAIGPDFLWDALLYCFKHVYIHILSEKRDWQGEEARRGDSCCIRCCSHRA